MKKFFSKTNDDKKMSQDELIKLQKRHEELLKYVNAEDTDLSNKNDPILKEYKALESMRIKLILAGQTSLKPVKKQGKPSNLNKM